jgi:hypothetical protein
LARHMSALADATNTGPQETGPSTWAEGQRVWYASKSHVGDEYKGRVDGWFMQNKIWQLTLNLKEEAVDLACVRPRADEDASDEDEYDYLAESDGDEDEEKEEEEEGEGSSSEEEEEESDGEELVDQAAMDDYFKKVYDEVPADSEKPKAGPFGMPVDDVDDAPPLSKADKKAADKASKAAARAAKLEARAAAKSEEV